MKAEIRKHYNTDVHEETCGFEEVGCTIVELSPEECDVIINALLKDFRSLVSDLADTVAFEDEGERENLEMVLDQGDLILKMVDLRDALAEALDEDDTE